MNIQSSLQKKHMLSLITLLALSLFGIKALIHPGLYTAHDIWHQVARLYHYYQAISDGQFPPYWITNLANGFGYPLFFFSYHLPWIIALPFLKTGISIPDTIKILFALSYILSGVFMYIFCFQLFKNKIAAFVSSVLYLWAPYHFVLIFVSAAIGQMFVFMFLPLILLGLLKRNLSLIALSFAGCILSHLMTTISLLPLIALFIIWRSTTYPTPVTLSKAKGITPPHILRFAQNDSLKVIIGFLLGIGLSAFYLLPAVYYSRLTQISTGAFSQLYKKHFIDLSQLIYSKWGYGIADTAKEMNISFQIGIPQWIALVACLIIVISIYVIPAKAGIQKRIKDWIPDKQAWLCGRKDQVRGDRKKIWKLNLIFSSSFILSVFLMLDTSRPLWDLASNFITFDYPTMFLLPVTFAGSVAGGLVVYALKGKLQILASVFLILTALYTNRNHIRVNEYTHIPVKEYVEAEITTNSFNEYLPKTTDNKLLTEPVPLKVHHFSFPGVNLYVDGKKFEHETDDRGRVVIPEVVENKDVFVKFEETNLIKVSKLITIASIIIVFLIVWQKIKTKLSQ